MTGERLGCVLAPAAGIAECVHAAGDATLHAMSALLSSRPRGLRPGALTGAILALLALGCGPKTSSEPRIVTPPLPDPIKIELEDVPAKLDARTIEPTSDDRPAQRSPLLDIMKAESDRWMAVVTKKPDPAYYISYQITDSRTVSLEAEGGALLSDDDDDDRQLDVDVRVGTPQLDNTRPLSDDPIGLNQPLNRHGVVPFGTDKQAIQHHLWLETDRRYREAVQALSNIQSDQRMLAQTNRPPDFVHEKPEVYIGAPATLTFDKEAWIGRLRVCSERANRGVATRGSCSVAFRLTTVYFVNSEGSQLQMSWTNAQLAVGVAVKADDGMPLSRLEQRFGVRPEDLPDDATIEQMITTVTSDLDALHEAPVVDPYVGPAILDGRAAGVFFHEVFGHRIEGHRQKDDTGGKTFSQKVDQQIMPDWLTVYDDPTIATLNGIQVNGFYRFDDEGVRARRTNLVDRGVLVGFLMGRNPIDGFATSNGHGRKQPGMFAVSRQGNLVVEAAKTVARDKLDELLLEEVKKQGRPFGMVFTDISGGFTNTSAFLPQAFKVNPVLAYRLYPDGRRELVRGVDIVGTPLTALGSIEAASREVKTFNGVCGAESGWVPVSASAPSLLVRQLEIEKGYTAVDRPPVLGPPRITTPPTPPVTTTGGSR